MIVIGLMSGTSLDGLDICLAEFSEKNGAPSYTILAAETVSYTEEWKSLLKRAEHLMGAELAALHIRYGKYLAMRVQEFLTDHNVEKKPELIASHGHTIYHRPEAGYTFQLGDGATIFRDRGIPVVCDFRSGDVALGGQGAPLVPMGDALLFGDYFYCLNLGGFANISIHREDPSKGSGRIAFDICAVNYVLNRLAMREGKEYDKGGALAAKGKLIPELLEKLNALPFYRKSAPKSLGREWVEANIFPMLEEKYSASDLIRTYSEHAAQQIAASCNVRAQMLVTGGGAHNTFFMELLRKKCVAEIVIPDRSTIDFKEALIFAFLGYLRSHNRINILSSVTGAMRDSCGGELFR